MSWQRQQKAKQRDFKKNKKQFNSKNFETTTPPRLNGRVFCNECNRKKLLFETEGKAKNFIKFNAAEIEDVKGFAPNRAYYCESCGGWHVTHKEDDGDYKLTPTQRAIAAYRMSVANIGASWQNVEYAGIFIDEESKLKLRNYVEGLWYVPKDYTEYLDHITLYHYTAFSRDCKLAAEVMKKIDKHIIDGNNPIKIRISAFGMIEGKVMAFKIATELPTTNETLHLTIGTWNGGKPMDSNSITKWMPMSNSIRISGTIKKIQRNKTFITFKNHDTN